LVRRQEVREAMALKTLTRWYGRRFNDSVIERLRSPDHAPHSRRDLLITVTGRKSGRQYTIPLNYRRTPEDTLVLGTEGDWWRNLEGGADVTVLVAGETLRARAEPILDDPEKRRRLGKLIAGPFWFVLSRSLVVIEVTVVG